MIDFTKLATPFNEKDVEWRLQSCGSSSKGFWGICLAYITNRAIQQRLDDVCGPENWKNEFATGPNGGILCGLSIRCNGEWVTKWDGAENTQVEAVKGGLSDSMKRAAVQWGIGRYLYSLDENWADVKENGKYRGRTKDGKDFKWNPPKLPSWALPKSTVKDSPEFIAIRKEVMQLIDEGKFTGGGLNRVQQYLEEKDTEKLKNAVNYIKSKEIEDGASKAFDAPIHKGE